MSNKKIYKNRLSLPIFDNKGIGNGNGVAYIPNVIRGGSAIPIGNNMFLMRGRSHAKGGIDIGRDLEVEGNEVVQNGKFGTKVFSSVPFLRGVSPAERVLRGENPDTVFAAQETWKRVNKVADDGSKRAALGLSLFKPNSFKVRRVPINDFITPTLGEIEEPETPAYTLTDDEKPVAKAQEYARAAEALKAYPYGNKSSETASVIDNTLFDDIKGERGFNKSEMRTIYKYLNDNGSNLSDYAKSAILATIAFESGANIRARNPRSSAKGYFQWLDDRYKFADNLSDEEERKLQLQKIINDMNPTDAFVNKAKDARGWTSVGERGYLKTAEDFRKAQDTLTAVNLITRGHIRPGNQDWEVAHRKTLADMFYNAIAKSKNRKAFGGEDGLFSNILKSIGKKILKIDKIRNRIKKTDKDTIYRKNLYNLVSPEDGYPITFDDYKRAFYNFYNAEKFAKKDSVVPFNRTVLDSTANAAWAKRLGLPYDKKFLIDNGDGSVRLSKDVENEIPIDTNFLKKRIEANKKLLTRYPNWKDEHETVKNGLLLDSVALDRLRHTYKTGKPVVLNEFMYNNRKWIKDDKTNFGTSPLNVLQDYTIQYDKNKNVMNYRDVYDFDVNDNKFEDIVPGEPFRIRGSIKLNKKQFGGMKLNIFKLGGLSRSKDYGSKDKPYPSVNKNDFAGGGRSYPIPTRADAVDALRLAGLHHRSDVRAKVYAKYPDLRKKAFGGKVKAPIGTWLRNLDELSDEEKNYIRNNATAKDIEDFRKALRSANYKNDARNIISRILNRPEYTEVNNVKSAHFDDYDYRRNTELVSPFNNPLSRFRNLTTYEGGTLPDLVVTANRPNSIRRIQPVRVSAERVGNIPNTYREFRRPNLTQLETRGIDLNMPAYENPFATRRSNYNIGVPTSLDTSRLDSTLSRYGVTPISSSTGVQLNPADVEAVRSGNFAGIDNDRYLPIRTTTEDWVGLGANLLGSIGSYLGTRAMLNRYPMPNKPVPAIAQKLKTRVNINPQLDTIREQVGRLNTSIDNNTSSSRVAQARKQGVSNNAVASRNQLYGQKENAETQLINQDIMNRQRIGLYNNQIYNDYLNRLGSTRQYLANARISNFNNVLSGANQSIQDLLGRIENRDADRRNFIFMEAAYPNVNWRNIFQNNRELARSLGFRFINN